MARLPSRPRNSAAQRKTYTPQAPRVISPSVAQIMRERARADAGLPPIKPSGVADQIRRELELADKSEKLRAMMRDFGK